VNIFAAAAATATAWPWWTRSMHCAVCIAGQSFLFPPRRHISSRCIHQTLPLISRLITLCNLLMKGKPLESIGQYVHIVSTSPAKNYILTIMLGIICVIFAVGLLCGRVTKRVRRELKNR